MYKKMYLLSFVLIFGSCSSYTHNAHHSHDNKKLKTQAKQAIKKMGGTLKKNLQKQIKTKGIVAAAKFCSLSAAPLMKKVSSTLPEGITVKRITSKPRNIKNKANSEEMMVLNDIKNKKSLGKMPKMIVKKISPNHHQIYKPIVMAGICLTCHGDSSVRHKGAYKEIIKHYPNDKAVNYKLGDLRGAFLVDIIK